MKTEPITLKFPSEEAARAFAAQLRERGYKLNRFVAVFPGRYRFSRSLDPDDPNPCEVLYNPHAPLRVNGQEIPA